LSWFRKSGSSKAAERDRVFQERCGTNACFYTTVLLAKTASLTIVRVIERAFDNVHEAGRDCKIIKDKSQNYDFRPLE
jgi:hypothetical protein